MIAENQVSKIIDPMKEFVGRVCTITMNDDSFRARLIDVFGNDLWFESRSGMVWMVNRQFVVSLKPLVPVRDAYFSGDAHGA